jgi:hypothetical protein
VGNFTRKIGVTLVYFCEESWISLIQILGVALVGNRLTKYKG